ncbi:amidase family [Cladorrhinum samala]|uniref:Amidase family n=1 Tax=Cladorrhinum samala TaxID=585594 RepID=A0AAV9HJP9_9PEZI|nr:amidase family [Cladorrhinum samala]
MAVSIDLLTATASDIQSRLSNQTITSTQLVKLYLNQIAQYDGYLKAVIAVAPEDLLTKTAAVLDQERAKGTVRGPLHGIPILIKDNIVTGPELGLPTTCGSLALVGSKPKRSAAVVGKLVAAGAIILGKANLSEWAWYRSDLADSGWSAVRGQTQSAYVRGGFRHDDSGGGHSNPGGSSSGSAVAVAAGFSPLSLGTETMGSLIMPSDRSALYTIKPTLKIVSQDGIIPVSFEADMIGPMAKSVLDLANLLDAIVDPTKTTVPRGGYSSVVTGDWGDIRIGVLEPEKWLFPPVIVKYEKQASDQMHRDWKAAYERLASVVKVVKPVTLLSTDESTEHGKKDINDAFHCKFKTLLESYLANDVDDCRIHTLKDLIKFNEDHADQELPPSADNQNGLIRALERDGTMTDEEYNSLVNYARDRCGRQGIDKVLDENGVDVIVGPGDGPLFVISGTAGYPGASLPLGYLDFNGRPFGLQVIAKAHQEALLIQVQSAWEATFPQRRPPPLDDIVGGKSKKEEL